MWALENRVDGIVTGPINKDVIRRGGFPGFTGHTEYLARLTGAQRPLMMLSTDTLKVVFVTTHIPLRSVTRILSLDLILDTVTRTHQWFEDFMNIKPVLAVAALNPHGGEGGSLGEEEESILKPAIETARSRGIDVQGPFAADTVFRRALQEQCDVVIALYHDQGMIAIKTDPLQAAVNTTLGLPIIRTSVDHGTAYDIAGKGFGEPDSLIKAIEFGRNLVFAKRLLESY